MKVWSIYIAMIIMCTVLWSGASLAQCTSGCTTTTSATTINTSSNGQVICINATPAGNVTVNLTYGNVTIRVCPGVDNVTFNAINVGNSNFTIETWGANTWIRGANVNTATFSFITHAAGARIGESGTGGSYNRDIRFVARNGGTMNIDFDLNPGGQIFLEVDTNSTMNTRRMTSNNGGGYNIRQGATLNVTGDLFVQSTTRMTNWNIVNVSGNMVVQGGANALDNRCGEGVITVQGEFNLNTGEAINNGTIVSRDIRINNGATVGPLRMAHGALLRATHVLRVQDKANVVTYSGTAGGCATFRIGSIETWNAALTTNNSIYYCGPTASAAQRGSATVSCSCAAPVTFCDPALPVELARFQATLSGPSVLLSWLTASERDNSHFMIERSKGNWHDFIPIGRVEGKGTTNNVVEYSFIDQEAGAGNFYYRLKQVDLDGGFTYSEMVHVNVPGLHAIDFTLGPNPSKDGTVTLLLPEAMGSSHIAVFDAYGLLVYETRTYERALNVALGNLASGVYHVKVQNEHGLSKQRLLIQK